MRRAMASSSSWCARSASTRLRLTAGLRAATGVSGAFRAARMRWSAPEVALANPPATLAATPETPRRFLLAIFAEASPPGDPGLRAGGTRSFSTQSTTFATCPGSPCVLCGETIVSDGATTAHSSPFVSGDSETRAPPAVESGDPKPAATGGASSFSGVPSNTTASASSRAPDDSGVVAGAGDGPVAFPREGVGAAIVARGASATKV